MTWDEPTDGVDHETLAEGWHECISKSGKHYYHNPTTGEDRWQIPTAGDDATGDGHGATSLVDKQAVHAHGARVSV